MAAMIQFRVLSGNKAGASWVARRFPVHIGRASTADLQLEDSGVWDDHLRLEFSRTEGVILKAQPDALIRLNGQPVQQTALHNGDVIELGAARLQFWLSETRQTKLWLREAFAWIIISGAICGQVALLYFLLS